MRTSAAIVRLVHEGDPIDEFGVEAHAGDRGQGIGGSLPPDPSTGVKAAIGGRWFVMVAVLGLLVIGQAPFVVLWALDFGRPISVIVTSGETVRHRFELAPAAAPAPRAAHLASLADAPRPARVTVAAPAPRGALSGWVKFDVPISLRILENGELLGTTEVDRLMLPAGEHLLDLQNDELHYRVQRAVDVTPGSTTTVQLELPRSSLSINARPWAEAWVDGERVGDTPIGNLVRPIGRHEIVLRHPKLGEHRESVLVTLSHTARVSVDLRGRSEQ
jgi:hypothetical protein